MGTLTGKVAIVTGCGRPLGMGEATALKLAEEGASVGICDLCRPYTEDLGLDADLVNSTLGGWEHLAELVRRIEAVGGVAKAFRTDVSSRTEVEALVAGTVSAFGRLDILVNSAATTVGVGPFLDMSETAWDKSFAVNVKGPFFCMRAAIPEMLKCGGGRIVNIITAPGGAAGYAGYTASKAALHNLTQSVAAELASQNILVNAVAPGWIATSMGKDECAWLAQEQGVTEAEVMNFIATRIPQQREGTARDVANVVYFLASDLSGYVVGETIQVNGGYHLADPIQAGFDKQTPDGA
jgi:NAD(P)-dependent dehydrogenase (short-subunit alcohol dehydrogenase family)